MKLPRRPWRQCSWGPWPKAKRNETGEWNVMKRTKRCRCRRWCYLLPKDSYREKILRSHKFLKSRLHILERTGKRALSAYRMSANVGISRLLSGETQVALAAQILRHCRVQPDMFIVGAETEQNKMSERRRLMKKGGQHHRVSVVSCFCPIHPIIWLKGRQQRRHVWETGSDTHKTESFSLKLCKRPFLLQARATWCYLSRHH